MTASFPLLTTLILWPMLAAALLLLLPNRLARSLALLAAMAQVVLATWLLTDMGPNFRWVERFEWIPSLKIQYLLGVDGLSMLFLPLAAWLFVAVIASGWNQVQTLPRVYYALLLMLEGITMGIFSALDTILFFLFWEASLIPLFVLILLWGVGPRRRMAAIKYTLLMLAGGVALLLGFIVAALHQMEMGNPWLFDLPLLLENPLPGPVQTWVFLLLLAGFAIKVPVIPLHTWLPLLALEGPIGVLAIMTGIKLGVYGLMRFAIPIAPQAALEYQWLLSVLGGIGVLYGSLAALLQTNVRPMLAFASIGHVGLVLMGLASFTQQGWHGAILQVLHFILASGGIFLMAGFLHHRFNSTDVAYLGGLAKNMPLAAGLFLFLGLAGLGAPLTAGFPAELLIYTATLRTSLGSVLVALTGQILAATYFITIYRRIFTGPLLHAASGQDLRQREILVALWFVVPILVLGIFPSLVLDLIAEPVRSWMAQGGFLLHK